MDARTPPPLKAEDLDRDELLQLIRRVAPSLRQRDLWLAKWEAASERAREAFEAECGASERYGQAVREVIAPKLSNRAWSRAREKIEASRREYERLQRSRKRADAAEERAYSALDACG